jgi:DNA recombination protein RmuC
MSAMEIVTAFAIAVVAAAAGLGAALLWSRARIDPDAKRAAESDAAQLRAQLFEAVQRSATLEERARNSDELRGLLREREQEIARLNEEASKARERAAELQTRLEEERQQSQEKLKLLAEAQRALENSFKSLSADALKSNNQSFLDLAKASLAEFQQGAKGDLERRQIAIESLVKPVRESLDKVDEKIGALERARESAYGEIRQQFTNMAEVQTQLRDETTNLVKALRQPHVRGRWGEIQLRRVVEMAGMMLHCDFVEQQSADSDDGKLRPDLVVKLPGGRQIVVDSKAPITAYMEAHEATTDEVRKVKILLHAQLMRRHLDALARKSYWEQFQPTPEVVVMFIPGEAFYSAALEADPDLLDSGFGQNVIIASPASLMALLKAASYGWRQEAIVENTREISQLGQELHSRLSVMAEHLTRLGRGLATATDSYNSAIASFESRVLVSARKFKEMGATSQDAEIIELRAVDGGVRRLQSVTEKPAAAPLAEEPKGS